MLLVHQMAKVGSQSWVQVAKSVGAAPTHCHFISDTNRARMKAALHDLRPTIANMIVPNTILRGGEAGAKAVNNARANGNRVRVITGMRDPVARAISLVMFFADFIGHTERPFSPKVQVSADQIVALLHETWEAVLSGCEPDATFEWLLWFFTGAYAHWFETEPSTVYGADIFAAKFDATEGAQRLGTPHADVFVYRVEDMLPSSQRHAALLARVSEFLGTTVEAIPSINTGESRRSRALYDDVRRGFRLPRFQLDSIYGASAVRHFYADAEIETFKNRWRAD